MENVDENSQKKYRKYNILLGDMVTDCLMEKNMNIDESIRIGFLDIDKSNLLENYLNNFDIVILGEGDYEVVTYLINLISGEKSDI